MKYVNGKWLKGNIRGKRGLWLNQLNRILTKGRPGGSDITWRDGGGWGTWLDIKVWSDMECGGSEKTDLARFLVRLGNTETNTGAKKSIAKPDWVWSRRENFCSPKQILWEYKNKNKTTKNIADGCQLFSVKRTLWSSYLLNVFKKRN